MSLIEVQATNTRATIATQALPINQSRTTRSRQSRKQTTLPVERLEAEVGRARFPSAPVPPPGLRSPLAPRESVPTPPVRSQNIITMI